MARCIGTTPYGKCNNEGTVRITLKNRGGRHAYMCPTCARRLFGYSDENDTRRGNVKMNAFTFSIELETGRQESWRESAIRGASLIGRAELINKGFMPTHDGTVDIEFKSPIYEGLNAPIAFLKKGLQPLVESGDINIPDNCGTHFHVGHRIYINPTTMDNLRESEIYHGLFDALDKTACSHPAEMAQLFGRPVTEYSYYAPFRNEDPMTHENWINVQHDWTIEFRICKYQNAEQYCKAMHVCKRLVELLIKFYLGAEEPNIAKASRQMNKALEKALGI